MNLPIQFVLASASPRRADLLRDAGYRFEIDEPEVEEAADSQPASLSGLTEANAALKAHHAAARSPGALCLGADTLVSIGGEALGKPADMEEAFAMLRRLAGQTHQVCTGVCLARHGGGAPLDQRFHTITKVTFKPLGDEEIHTYLQLIHPLDKAGAYAAQEHGERVIERTCGSYSNVVGLPMEDVIDALAALGIRP
jgi:septum formation protein